MREIIQALVNFPARVRRFSLFKALNLCRHRFLRLPGMTGYQERMDLVRICQQELKGTGAAIEFGAFLGASTAAIQHGIRSNAMLSPTTEFHVVDCFKTPTNSTFAQYVREFARAGRVDDLLTEKDSWLCFFDAFISNVDAGDQHLVIHRCFVSDFSWKTQPVEFIHLDLPKDWNQAENIISQIFPDLVLDAKVLFQDFCYQWSAELIGMVGHLIRMGHIRPCRVTDTTLTCSVAKRFTLDDLEILTALMCSPNEILSGLDIAREECAKLTSPALNSRLLMAKAQYLYSICRVNECFDIISTILVTLSDEKNKDEINRLTELFEHHFVLPTST